MYAGPAVSRKSGVSPVRDNWQFSILETAYRVGIRVNDRTLDRTEVEAYCPFCNRRHDHLYLNVVKNQYFCQACKTGGDSVDLYARMRGLSRDDAFRKMSEDNIYMLPRPQRPRQDPAPMAPLERRHDVYYDLLHMLKLSSEHLYDLIGRGLSLARTEQNLYRSTPVPERLADIAALLSRQYDVQGIPGFYTDPCTGRWKLWIPDGLILPICTAQGYIQGLQVRLDRAHRRKCRWVSSNPELLRRDGSQSFPNGTKARTWVHVTGNASSDTAHITEGALKGDVASFLDGDALYVCTPGVSSIALLPDAIRSLNVKQLIGEYDMDQCTDKHSSLALNSLQKELKPLGIPFRQSHWDPDYNGTDDYKLHCRYEAA